jgi:hypothetical protein
LRPGRKERACAAAGFAAKTGLDTRRLEDRSASEEETAMTLQIVPSFGRIGEENAFAVLARATELQRQGKDIINLGIGQPDFPTPAISSRPP